MSQSAADKSDLELEQKAKKVSDRLSESVNMIANEPSLAFYRIQEHVRKSLPLLVEQKHEMQEIQSKVQGACFDTEYATNTVNQMSGCSVHLRNIQEILKNAMFITVNQMSGCSVHLQNIQELLKNAMFMKQQIEYDQHKRLLESQDITPVVTDLHSIQATQ